MGERIELGNLAYNVYESRWQTQLGEAPSARVPERRFFLVKFSVTNTGAAEVMAPVLTVTDAKGTKYRNCRTAVRCRTGGYLRNVKPRQTVRETRCSTARQAITRCRLRTRTSVGRAGGHSADSYRGNAGGVLRWRSPKRVNRNRIASGMRPILLLIALAAAADAAGPLAIVSTVVEQGEGGLPLPASFEVVPGEVLFFSFRCKGYDVSAEHKIRLQWKMDAFDPRACGSCRRPRERKRPSFLRRTRTGSPRCATNCRFRRWLLRVNTR